MKYVQALVVFFEQLNALNVFNMQRKTHDILDMLTMRRVVANARNPCFTAETLVVHSR